MTEPILQSDDIDRLGQALITLTRELWILKDRQRVLEGALIDAGVLDRDAVDNYQPDAALTETLEAERKRIIDELINALITPQSITSNDD
jgi:hypothetical protein